MTERDLEIQTLENQILTWKSYKNPPGTKIYYAQKRLLRLKAGEVPKTGVKRAPRTLQSRDRYKPDQAKACPENRAYVLSREIYDLTQAMVALERLR